MRLLGLTGLLLLLSWPVLAQEKGDTLILTNLTDTARLSSQRIERIESYASRYDPRKALMYSAIFPGSGQIYNKKYWKLPLVYGGFAVTTVVVVFWDNSFNKYRNELFYVLNNTGTNITTSPSGLTSDQLRRAVDISRRQRDFFILLSGVWYLLQLVDAHVDAHLKEFQLNPKMQVKWEPRFENNLATGRTAGISLTLRF